MKNKERDRLSDELGNWTAERDRLKAELSAERNGRIESVGDGQARKNAPTVRNQVRKTRNAVNDARTELAVLAGNLSDEIASRDVLDAVRNALNIPDNESIVVHAEQIARIAAENNETSCAGFDEVCKERDLAQMLADRRLEEIDAVREGEADMLNALKVAVGYDDIDDPTAGEIVDRVCGLAKEIKALNGIKLLIMSDRDRAEALRDRYVGELASAKKARNSLARYLTQIGNSVGVSNFAALPDAVRAKAATVGNAKEAALESVSKSLDGMDLMQEARIMKTGGDSYRVAVLRCDSGESFHPERRKP